MGLTVIRTLLLQREGKLFPHKRQLQHLRWLQAVFPFSFSVCSLGANPKVQKTTDFSNRPFLKTRDISPRQSHRVGYPWHSTQMGSSHSKSNRGSWHWVSWSLNTGWRKRILAWKIWLQDETGSSIHFLLLIIIYTKDAEAYYGQIKCPRHVASFLWFSQSVSQACNPIPENLHTYI